MAKKNNNLLEFVPRRAEGLEWTEHDNGTVTLHRKNTGFYNKLAQKFFHKPPVTYVKLERYGSYLWLLIDGEKTVQELSVPFKEHFGEEVEPLYPRMAQYIRALQANRFITVENPQARR